MAIDRRGATKKKPKNTNHKRNTREYIPPKKEAKKPVKKKKKEEPKKDYMPKTKSGVVSSHYGQVASKTQNTEENRRNASIKKAAGSVKKSLTVTDPNAKKVGTSWGNVTEKSQDRTFTDKKWTPKDVKEKVNPHVAKDEGVKYVKEQGGTAKGTDVAKAYNKGKNIRTALEKEGRKTVQVDSEKEIEKNAVEIRKANWKGDKDFAKQEYRWLKENGYDVGGMTEEEFVEKYRKDTKADRTKAAEEQAKKDSKYTYSKAPVSVDQFMKQMNASQMQNAHVKTATDKEKYVTDKNGNIKYDFKVDKDGNLIVEPKKKKGNEKVDTTAGANIIDYYAGGFEDGKLKSQAGSEKVANQRAGWLRDSKFMAGAMQGAGYSDIKQGIGKYGKAAEKDVERSTSSGAFNAGYMAGFMGQFGMLGAGKIPDTFVRGVGKKGLQRGAINIGARKAAVSMAAELPINTVDALKMATDANGNVDKKSLAGWLALNTALSGGATGIMGAGGAKMTKSQAREYLNLNAKAQSGAMLTEDELSKLSSFEKKLQDKGYNIANSDIANKAQYDAEVGWKVFENGGTAKEAAEAMNGAATNVAKLNYASSIKAEADTQFEALRVARQNLLKELDNATPEQKVAIREQAAVWKKEIDRLGEISNVADRELNLAKEANKKGVRNLTKSLDNMSQKTGTEYHALNDVEMRDRITKVMNEKADRLEAGLAKLSPEEQARVSERIKQLRKGASEDEFYSGFYYKDVDGKTKVLINTDSPQAHQTIVGHETGHIIKANNAHEFEQLGTMLEQYAKKAGDYDAVYNQIKNSYPEATEADLREEVTCELLGRYVYGNDDAFIKQIAGENPTLVQRIIDYIKELFDKTTDREMKAELKAIRDKAQKAVDSLNPKEIDVEAGSVHSVDENISMKSLDKSGAVLEKDGQPVAEFVEDGSFKFSLGTYDGKVATPDGSGREQLTRFLDNLVESKEMTRAEADQTLDEIERIYEVCKNLDESGEYAPFSQWSSARVIIDDDGHPVFSSVIPNNEYDLNIDFSTICKKRRTLDAVFNELIKRNVISDLEFVNMIDSARFVVEINDIVRKHGFEAACEVCFVEARRYRQHATAETFSNMYNDLVESMYKDKSKIARFNYGENASVKDVKDGLHTMKDADVDTSRLEQIVDNEVERLANAAKKQKTADKIRSEQRVATVEAKIAKFLLNNPEQRKLLDVGDMMSSVGFKNMQVKNPELMKIYNAKKGAGGAKSSFGDVQYLNEIIKQDSFDRMAAYAVGGVRAQSFSDYVPRMVFDYVQMVADLAAKRLPMHVYTKEPLFAKQFGLTGIKINLSLVPDYVEDGIAAGLDAKGNYIWNANGTFPFEEAMALQKADGYSQNCGTIAVGVSPKHITKMLDDPDIQMIIPYHKSGINPVIADRTNIGKFTDYTNFQETKVRYGSKESVGSKNDFPWNEELYKLSHGEDGKLLPKEQWGDARELSNRYLAWCDEHGYQPKFPQFKDHPNYYKLLEDFSLYDGAGNFKPQHDVQMKFPTSENEFGSMTDLIKSGLEEDAILEGKRAHDIPKIADEVEKVAREKGWLSDDVKFSKGGRGAVGADTNAADLAVKLKSEGLSNAEIKELTGWYVAQDGKPRFEFSDAEFKVKDDVWADFHPEKPVSGKRYVTAYNRFSSAIRDFYIATDGLASSSPKTLELINKYRRERAPLKELRSKLKAAAKDGEVEEAVISEEVAKAYQRVLTSDKTVTRLGRGKQYPESVKLGDLIEHEKLFELYPDAKKINVSVTDELGDGINGEYADNHIRIKRGRTKAETEDTLIHEVQHWIQDQEDFARGASEDFYHAVSQNVTKKMFALMGDLSDETRESFRRNPPSESELQQALKDEVGEKAEEEFVKLRNVERLIGDRFVNGRILEGDKYKAYSNTLGEREARDTSERRALTQEQIDNSEIPPYADMDSDVIKREDLWDKEEGFKFSKQNITPKTITDKSGNITREADYAYGQAVKTGDMETAQKMVDAALESKGFKYDMYHGSDDFGFTEFKLDEMRVRDKQNKDLAVYLSSEHDVAASYTRNQHIRNLVDKQLDEDSFAELAKVADPEFDIDKLDEIFALKPVKDALEDWRKDFVEYKGDVSPLRGYIEDMIDDARGYTNDLGVEIPKETLDEIYRLADKIDKGVVKGGVYRGKGKIDKPLVISAYGGNWANISIEDAAMRKKLAEKFGDRYGFSTRQIVEYALDDGQYDGVIFKDLYDTGTWGDVHTNLNTYGKSDVYVIFNSNQFKVSDPVVRDNNGDIIPLSERGNENSADFRFSKQRKSRSQIKQEKLNRLNSEIEGLEGEKAAATEARKALDEKNVGKMSSVEADKHLAERNKATRDVETAQSKIDARNEEIDKTRLIKAQREAKNKAAEKPTKADVKETSAKEKPSVESKKTKDASFRDTEDYKTFKNNKYHSAELNERVDKAIDYGVDVSKRIKEFNEQDAIIRENKGKLNNSKTPENIARYQEEIEKAKAFQDQIARSIYQDVHEARLEFAESKGWKAESIDEYAKSEINEAAKNVGGIKQISSDIKKARADKMGSKKAQKLVAEEMKDYDSCLEKYLKEEKDPDMQNARASALLDNISERLTKDPEDAGALADLMKVVDKLGEDGTLPVNVRSSAKQLATSTPKGRIGVALKACDDLNKKYGDRIDGVLKLTDEDKVRLATSTGEELEQAYADITARWWDEIPATNMEKFNEIRHMFMLANVRTHARNIFGNISFRGVRFISDSIETLMQDKMFRGAIEARGGQVDKVFLEVGEISRHDDYLTQEFHAIYDTSGSVNRYIEVDRPDGVPTVKAKALNALIQGDYKALEIEDMWTFIPAFKKSYMKYVKSKGWDIEKLTEAQKKMARERALFDAEYATFRDTSAFSAWLTGKKHMLATKEGETIFGTMGYRFMNAAMEGILPFVKTPVNIFRRSVDYSPISLIRCLGELTSKDPEVFKQGIHHLASGLTGTGIFGLGYYLSNAGFISIETNLGRHSGSKYYDQDMGYQEYSLVINVGGKKQSWSIDWLQPMQASLFMGAVARDMIDDIKSGDFELGSSAISGLFGLTAPIFDASFMSSAKDMMETFEKRASRETDEGEPNMSGALVQMLLGDIPKNYLSSAIPQVIGQAANISDDYQRDTRSTLKDPLFASWDSAAKQIANRIPVLRQKILNPKIDRWGEDKKTPENLAIRIINAAFNPSNVKDITENKYDRELFKIRNGLEKGSKDYKDFFYNFTGNPNYELDFGKGRMSYDKAYEYGKATRKEQAKIVKQMIDSPTYKEYMTNDMKAQEVKQAYWTAAYKGDQTIGDMYAAKRIAQNENGEDEAYRFYKQINSGRPKKEVAKEFVDFYVKKEELYQRSHAIATNDTYSIKALAACMYNKKMLEVYDVEKRADKIMPYWKNILKETGNRKDAIKKATDEITMFTCGSTYYLKEGGINKNPSKGYQSVALGKMAKNGDKNPERVYRAMGFDWNEAQGGAGLMLKYNKGNRYSYAKLEQMKYELKHNYDVDDTKTLTKADVETFVRDKGKEYGIKDEDELACLFSVVAPSNWTNPWGTIKDHLEWGTEPDEYGSGGRRRGGGWGHRGGGGGGGSKGAMPKTKSGAFDAKITDPYKQTANKSKSNLDDAYRKRVKKLRQKQ